MYHTAAIKRKYCIKGLYNSEVKVFIFLVIFLPPAIVNNYEYIDAVINILRIFSALLVFSNYFLCSSISKLFRLESCIWVAYLIYCWLNGTWQYNRFVTVLIILSLTAMIESCFNKGYENYFYKGLRAYLLIFLLINTFTLFMSGNIVKIRSSSGAAIAEQKYLFLGFDNDLAIQLVPLIGVLFYGNKNKRDRIDLFILILTFFNFLLTASASGMMVYFIFIVFYLFRNHDFILKHMKSSMVILFFAVLWMLIYFLQIQRFFSFLISNILGRSLDFTGRMLIWQDAIYAIQDSWLIGYGDFANNPAYADYFTNLYLSISPSPHNIFLYICSMGGVVGLFLFVYLIIFAFRNVDKNIRRIKNATFLLATLFCYFLCGQVSSVYAMEQLSVLLCVAYYARPAN